MAAVFIWFVLFIEWTLFGIWGRYAYLTSTSIHTILNQYTVPIMHKLEQKFFLVAAMSNVPNMAGQKITMSAWHDAPSLKRCFIP